MKGFTIIINLTIHVKYYLHYIFEELMSKEELIELHGIVKQVLPNSMCRVELTNGIITLAYISGKMKKNRIGVLEGDKVIVETTIANVTRSRLKFREKAN